MQQYPTVCISSSSTTHVGGGSACWIRAEPILLQWHGGYSDILCGVLQRLCHGVMGCPLGVCCGQILSSWAMVWSPRHVHMAGWTDSWISNWHCGMENSPDMCCWQVLQWKRDIYSRKARIKVSITLSFQPLNSTLAAIFILHVHDSNHIYTHPLMSLQ